MLKEQTLFGEIDKVDLAIRRIKLHEPPEGYYVAFSGGKDSCVILDLVKRAGVKFDAHLNITTVDPPEVIRFVRQNYPEVTMEKPKISMKKLIEKKGILPTRLARYCCAEFKERGGTGRFVVTGVRHAITDVLDRLNARPEYDDGRYEYLYHENTNPPYFELFDGYEGDDLTLLQGEFLLIDREGRLSKLSSEEATQAILKGVQDDERVRI